MTQGQLTLWSLSAGLQAHPGTAFTDGRKLAGKFQRVYALSGLCLAAWRAFQCAPCQRPKEHRSQVSALFCCVWLWTASCLCIGAMRASCREVTTLLVRKAGY